MNGSDGFEWRVPHNENSLADAVLFGERLLQMVVEKNKSRLIVGLLEHPEGDSKQFKFDVAYCQFAGRITADRDDVIFSWKRPLAGMFFGQKIQTDLKEQAAELAPQKEEFISA